MAPFLVWGTFQRFLNCEYLLITKYFTKFMNILKKDFLKFFDHFLESNITFKL